MFFRNFFLIVLSFLLTLPACTKKKKEEASTKEVFTNCKIPVADGRYGAALGFPRYSDRLPTTGTVNVSVIFVDFPDSPATKTPAEAYAMVSGATATFNEMSYGKLQYTMTATLQWFRMSKNSTEYSLGAYETHHAYIQEALNLADPTVDFSTTQSLVVISNPDTTAFPVGPALLVPPGYGVTADAKEILNAVTSGHDLNNWGSIWLNHEATHTLGLPDLYAYTTLNASNQYDLLRYTGMFSYMGYGSFDSYGPGLTAWERWLLGWLDDEQMQCANPLVVGEISTLLTPIGTTGGKKAVVVPIGATKVLVVESRRAQAIDALLPKLGALVYTVDSSIASGGGPIKVYPASAADPLFAQSIRSVGESVSIDGFVVEVLSSDSSGDTIRIKAE